MPSFSISARGAFKTAMMAGALALTVTGATLATAEPAAAFVHHGGYHHAGFHHGGVHHGDFGHGFAYGRGRPFGHHGFRFGVVARPYGFGPRRFAYGYGVPVYRYGAPLCGYGRHFVPGLGCRLNLVYRVLPRVVPVRVGYRPVVYGVRRVVRPSVVYRPVAYGFGHYGPGRHVGHLRFVGLHHGGFRHAGVHHGFHHAGFHRAW